MRLIPNARQIALRSYSMWASYLGIASLILPEVIFWLSGRDTDPRLWWIMGLALIIGGIIGRVVAQGIDHSKLRSSAVGAFLVVAVALVGKWEGKTNHAFLDKIASPPVWTVCHGETRGVMAGDHYTDAQCKAMLKRGLLEYRAGLHRHFTNETKSKRLTPQREAAYVSLAWNVGIAGAGRSTATRRLNAGDIAGGCTAITWWNRAGKYVIRGLVNRRADEYRLCMAGL